MNAERLARALREGAFELPASGRIALAEPRADDDVSALPADRVEVISRRFPVHRDFERRGLAVTTEPGGPYALALMSLPRARDEARDLFARLAAATEGPVVVDGDKTDGIDGFLRELRGRADAGPAISKAHGKIFAVTGAGVADWRSGGDLPPGVFSADGPDPGSRALAEALPAALSGRVVDLGAGWGFLSQVVLGREGVTALDLVESDHAALQAARQRIADPRAAFHWADARDWRPESAADHVVTNPPFHQGRRADPSLGRAFIAAAGRMLSPRGRLWLVANRHLPYEAALSEHFAEVTPLPGPAAFKIYAASRPRSPARSGPNR